MMYRCGQLYVPQIQFCPTVDLNVNMFGSIQVLLSENAKVHARLEQSFLVEILEERPVRNVGMHLPIPEENKKNSTANQYFRGCPR